MIATHIDYKHPRHLRVVEGKEVWCVAPTANLYRRAYRSGLPSWRDEIDESARSDMAAYRLARAVMNGDMASFDREMTRSAGGGLMPLSYDEACRIMNRLKIAKD